MKPLFTPKTKKVLFFDVNQTLIDRKQAFRAGFIGLLQDFAARSDTELDLLNPDQILRSYNKALNSQTTARGLRLDKQVNSLRQAFAGQPLPRGDKFLRAFAQALNKEQNLHAQPVAGVSQTLQYLSRGYTLAILSNGDHSRLLPQLEHAKLSPYFDKEHIFTSSMLGARKPNMTIYLNAVEKMKVKPKEAVMIGDSWRKDAEGPAKAGLDAIWISIKPGKAVRSRVDKDGTITTVPSIDKLVPLFEV